MTDSGLTLAKIPKFDAVFDVIVVGYGFAGGVAAIWAADGGAKVLLAEKAEQPGGISICSGGTMRSAHSADDAFAYLKATNGGRTPDDVIWEIAKGMAGMEAQMRQLASICNGEITIRDKTGNYPFPGTDTFYHTSITKIPGYEEMGDAYPHVMARPSANGWRMFKVLEQNIARRAVEIRCSFAANRLIANERREVLGVWFKDKDGRMVAVKARRGVILACGGFEANDEMKAQFWEKGPVLAATSSSNAGDGIRMAQELGADLWHMWHYHGAYGFKHTDSSYPVAIRVKRLPDWFPGRERTAQVKMCWIVVDQDGRRYMNECPPYMQDTSHRPMQLFDPVRQKFPRVPSYLIYDENGRKMYPIGAPTHNQVGLTFSWSEDNMREVELGIIKKADSLEQLAQLLGANPAVLQATLDRWNELCGKRRDLDFARPPGTMTRIDTPPYYVGEIWPVVSNTQGGPVHNARQQILNVFGEPIPRLYAAGELGSAFGYLYLSGGNLTECMVTGRISGNEASALAPWDAELEISRAS
jgi:succinate dehydrogenase/fumarate reductase flavoprotein subunit